MSFVSRLVRGHRPISHARTPSESDSPRGFSCPKNFLRGATIPACRGVKPIEYAFHGNTHAYLHATKASFPHINVPVFGSPDAKSRGKPGSSQPSQPAAVDENGTAVGGCGQNCPQPHGRGAWPCSRRFFLLAHCFPGDACSRTAHALLTPRLGPGVQAF